MNNRWRQKQKATRMIEMSIERKYSLNVTKMRNALMDSFKLIGEAIVKVSDELKGLLSAIDWEAVKGENTR